MLAGRYNMVCDQGSTFLREITVTDQLGVPLDLTNYAPRMQIRKDVDATTTLLELTVANGRLTITPLLGLIVVSLSPTLTASLTKSGVYDLEIVHSSTGVVYKIIRGEFRLEKEVTR